MQNEKKQQISLKSLKSASLKKQKLNANPKERENSFRSNLRHSVRTGRRRGTRSILLDGVVKSGAPTRVRNCGGGDFIDYEGATSTSVGAVVALRREIAAEMRTAFFHTKILPTL